MLHPDLAMTLARDRQRELIAEAEQYRRLAAARRRPAAGGEARGANRSTSRRRFGRRAGDTLVRWVDRVPVPPR